MALDAVRLVVANRISDRLAEIDDNNSSISYLVERQCVIIVKDVDLVLMVVPTEGRGELDLRP